jgi:hypothetical protein
MASNSRFVERATIEKLLGEFMSKTHYDSAAFKHAQDLYLWFKNQFHASDRGHNKWIRFS